MNVPEEIEEEFLFSLTSPRDLVSICSTSSLYRSICSDYGFWREKFTREGLSLDYLHDLGKRANPVRYVEEYKIAVEEYKIARKLETFYTTENPYQLEELCYSSPFFENICANRDLWKKKFNDKTIGPLKRYEPKNKYDDIDHYLDEYKRNYIEGEIGEIQPYNLYKFCHKNEDNLNVCGDFKLWKRRFKLYKFPLDELEALGEEASADEYIAVYERVFKESLPPKLLKGYNLMAELGLE